MRLKGLLVIAVMLMLLCSSAGIAQAYEGSFAGAMHKLGRGISNIVCSPFEICSSIDIAVNDNGLAAGIPIGILQGIGQMVCRIGSGLYDFVSCPAGNADDYLMSPEFVFSGTDDL